MLVSRYFPDSNFLCSSAPNVSNNKRLLVIVRVIVAGIRYTYWMSVSSTWTSVLLPVIRAWTPTAYMFVTAFITIIINWMRMCSITSCGTVMTMDRKLPDSSLLSSSTPKVAYKIRLQIVVDLAAAIIIDGDSMTMASVYVVITHACHRIVWPPKIFWYTTPAENTICTALTCRMRSTAKTASETCAWTACRMVVLRKLPDSNN